jgi:hypothetical protein
VHFSKTGRWRLANVVFFTTTFSKDILVIKSTIASRSFEYLMLCMQEKRISEQTNTVYRFHDFYAKIFSTSFNTSLKDISSQQRCSGKIRILCSTPENDQVVFAASRTQWAEAPLPPSRFSDIYSSTDYLGVLIRSFVGSKQDIIGIQVCVPSTFLQALLASRYNPTCP